MEVKEAKIAFPEAFSSPDVRSESQLGGAPKTPKKNAPSPQPETVFVEAPQDVEPEAAEFDKKTVADLMERTADLLTTFDRDLKYEVLEDAVVVQIQVIDPRDGRIVRKIPADEVIRLIEAMKSKIDDRVDVWA